MLMRIKMYNKTFLKLVLVNEEDLPTDKFGTAHWMTQTNDELRCCICNKVVGDIAIYCRKQKALYCSGQCENTARAYFICNIRKGEDHVHTKLFIKRGGVDGSETSD